MNQDKAFVWKSHWEHLAWVGLKVGWSGVSGNHQGMVNSVSQADGDSGMVPACCLCRGGLIKGTVSCTSTMSGRKLPSQLSPWSRHCSSSPHVPGSFQAAALSRELRRSQSKEV